MAQVIQPEVWCEGIDDNRLLPGRYTNGLFIGNIQGANKSIANNPAACRVWDIQIPDYITDYDDRRLNGLANIWSNGQAPAGFNENGRDGWGASAYGVFQDVRFDSRVYTMGRHRSVAFRIFDEMQYAGGIGDWGTASTSNVITPGQSLMQTAALLSKTKSLWDAEVLGPDIDKYNLFAVINGHISGRWVANNPDEIFNGDPASGQWVAQPGMVQGQAIPPRFAPIHAIEWDDENIALLLSNIKVTWNNLFIPEDNRVILIDPFYEVRLLFALTGSGVPATEAAYSDMENGTFRKLMGWEFRFDIPTQYWPKIYVDDNLNVIHSADGKAAYDAVINSTNHDNDGDKKLMLELADADRMNRPNYIRTVWVPASGNVGGHFEKIVTNYPLGMPAAVDYMGTAMTVDDGLANYALPTAYPWTAPGSGYGLNPYDASETPFPGDSYATGPIIGGAAAQDPNVTVTPVQTRQVIGLALYKKAAQLSQEYSEMKTEEGGTRGKFTEMVFDVKYDAWVIESLSHGIIPIIDSAENTGVFGIPVKIIYDKYQEESSETDGNQEQSSETDGNQEQDGD